MVDTTEWWRLIRGAAELGLPYNVALRKVLTRELRGEQRDGKWWVSAQSVRDLREQREREPLPAA